MIITSPIHTSFEMGSVGCNPEPSSFCSWAGAQKLATPVAYL